MTIYGNCMEIFKENDKYGIVNKLCNKEEILVEPIYDSISKICDTVYCLDKGNERYFAFLKCNKIIRADKYECMYHDKGLIVLCNIREHFKCVFYDQYTALELATVNGMLYSDVETDDGIIFELSNSGAEFTKLLKIYKRISNKEHDLYEYYKTDLLEFKDAKLYGARHYFRPNGKLLGYVVDEKGVFYFVDQNLNIIELKSKNVTFEVKVSYNNGDEICHFKDDEIFTADIFTLSKM